MFQRTLLLICALSWASVPGLVVSNPRNEALDVRLVVNLALEGPGAEPSSDPRFSRVWFELPGGVRAGASVVRGFTIR